MAPTHRGMEISQSDWQVFIGYVKVTLEKLQVPEREKGDVLGFIESTRADIVEK